MLRPTIAVIADDFTGACDTGAQLAYPADPCPVLLADTHTPVSLLGSTIARAGRVACDTETRNVAPEAAAGRVGELCRSISGIDSAGGRGVELIYKKIDSTLRGNISVELSALHTAFPERVLLMAPAFPAVGRTTVEGRCLVNGVPVHLTEFGRDTLSPVHSSDLTALLPSACHAVVCKPRELAAVLPSLGPGDAVVVDAQAEADLREIVAAAADHIRQLIFVGSAGLAAAIAAALAPELPPRGAASTVVSPDGSSPHGTSRRPSLDRASPDGASRPPSRAADRRVVLGLVGSLSERSRRQAELLVKEGQVICLELGACDAGALMREAIGALSHGHDVVVLTPPVSSTTAGDRPEPEIAAELAGTLGKIARQAVAGVRRLGLFVTGGDCAVATIRAIGGDMVNVYSEVQPGVPLIGIIGTQWGEVRAVTKAGGFGADDIMVKSFDCLRGQR